MFWTGCPTVEAVGEHPAPYCPCWISCSFWGCLQPPWSQHGLHPPRTSVVRGSLPQRTGRNAKVGAAYSSSLFYLASCRFSASAYLFCLSTVRLTLALSSLPLWPTESLHRSLVWESPWFILVASKSRWGRGKVLAASFPWRPCRCPHASLPRGRR